MRCHNHWNFENIGDPILKALLKNHNHTSVLAIKEENERGLVFTFNNIAKRGCREGGKTFRCLITK